MAAPSRYVSEPVRDSAEFKPYRDGKLGNPVFYAAPLTWQRPVGRAHRHVPIYKDVKPENVFVDDAVDVWLTVFGTASRRPRERQKPAPSEVVSGAFEAFGVMSTSWSPWYTGKHVSIGGADRLRVYAVSMVGNGSQACSTLKAAEKNLTRNAQGEQAEELDAILVDEKKDLICSR